MRDTLVVSGLVLSFAVLITVHLTVVFGLIGQRPRWRALAAFAIPPLAPFFAHRAGLRVRGALWVVSATAYAALLFLASR